MNVTHITVRGLLDGLMDKTSITTRTPGVDDLKNNNKQFKTYSDSKINDGCVSCPLITTKTGMNVKHIQIVFETNRRSDGSPVWIFVLKAENDTAAIISGIQSKK